MNRDAVFKTELWLLIYIKVFIKKWYMYIFKVFFKKNIYIIFIFSNSTTWELFMIYVFKVWLKPYSKRLPLPVRREYILPNYVLLSFLKYKKFNSKYACIACHHGDHVYMYEGSNKNFDFHVTTTKMFHTNGDNDPR